MSNESQAKNPQLALAELMNQYTQLLTQQLRNTKELLSSSVQGLMSDLMSLNELIEHGKKTAETALENTFVAPDQETAAVVDAVQAKVEEVFQSAQAMLSQTSGEDTSQLSQKLGNSSLEMDSIVKKANEKFQSHMTDFVKIETSVTDLLLKMTGTLSSDDVIAHYMRHVSAGMHIFEAELSTILFDIEARCTPENIQRMRNDLFEFNFRQYSSTEERIMLETYFPKSQ
jgi:hypothetical protein